MDSAGNQAFWKTINCCKITVRLSDYLVSLRERHALFSSQQSSNSQNLHLPRTAPHPVPDK